MGQDEQTPHEDRYLWKYATVMDLSEIFSDHVEEG